MISKLEARNRGWAVRARLSLAERVNRSALAVSQIKLLDWSTYRWVQLFLPIERQREVDTWPLVRWLREMHPRIAICVPRMEGGAMTSVRLAADTEFKLSGFGVPEPRAGKVVSSNLQFDLIVVPLLAFDQAGHRVGYGGGHYDRFLTGQPQAHKVGLGFAECLVEEGIAAEAHDVALDTIIAA